MKSNRILSIRRIVAALSGSVGLVVASGLAEPAMAAESETTGIVKVQVYTGITGTPVDNLLFDPKFPASPDRVQYLSGLSYGQPTFGGTVGDNYGVLITGVLIPPTSGNYYFFIRSDDASRFFLNATGPAIPDPLADAPIAEEADCCDAFQEIDTGDPSTTATPVALEAGQRYGFAFVVKEGTGGDWGQVAWRMEGDTTPAAQLAPIAGPQVAAVADATGASVTITQNLPASASVAENDALTLSATADTVVSATAPGLIAQPAYQWFKDGKAIQSYGPTFPIGRVLPDQNGAKYKVMIMVPGAFAVSQETTITVTADVTRPTAVAAKGSSDLATLFIDFSEDIDPASATDIANYSVSPALTLSDPVMIGTRRIQFTTSAQTLGTEYTVTINNVKDASTAANAIAANSTIKFRGIGAIQQRDDGFIVFEAESYDRRLGTLWRENSTRGTRSGGVAMEVPDNVSDSEANDQLLFDVNFVKTGVHHVWYRAVANDGNADSIWFHLDGARPAERAGGNQASMSGFNVGAASDFVWRSDAQDAPDPFTVEIPAEGLHTIGFASREDGSIIDKMVITTDPAYRPTGLGPNPTPRQGEPTPPPDLTITLQPVSATVVQNRPVSFTTAATTGDPALQIQWQRKQGDTFQDIAGATGNTFSISQATLDWNGAILRAKVSIPGATLHTDEVTLTVNADTTAPAIEGAGAFAGASTVGVAFNEALDATTAADATKYTVNGSAATAAKVYSERIVELTVATPLTADFTLGVNEVKDTAGNPLTIATVAGKLSDLTAQDLGFPSEPGTGLTWGTGFFIAAGGNDIWGNADNGYIVSKPFTGAFDMRARVDSLINGDEWGKATLMARETIDAGSRNQAVLITKNGPYPTANEPAPGPYRNGGVNVYNHQWRDTTDGASASKATAERISPTVFPSWLRLVRESATTNQLKSYISYDGEAWIAFHTYTTPGDPLPETLILGMAVTAHDDAIGFARAEAIYENFSIQPFQVIVDPNLSVTREGGQVVIRWAAGTLVSSATVNGTYTPVAGATSPYPVNASAETMFYQILR